MVPDDNDTFEDFLTVNARTIRRMSRDGRWRIPWQDREETEADLAMILYTAYLHYKPRRGPFIRYFNTLWVHFKINAIKHADRKVRSVRVVIVSLDKLMDEDDFDLGVEEPTPMIEIPPGDWTPAEHAVWTLIQLGYSPRDIQTMVPIHRVAYYRLLNQWKEQLR